MNYSIIITCVLVAIATSYMTGNARKNTAAARTPDGMRVLRNKRLGVVALVTMVAIGAGLMGLGVLCFLDIGLGQGGIVLAFFGLGAGMVLLGFFFRHLSDRNCVCFDQEKVIRYRAIGAPVQIFWSEVVSYSCDTRRTFIAAADGRRITADYTFDGLQELVEMIQRLG